MIFFLRLKNAYLVKNVNDLSKQEQPQRFDLGEKSNIIHELATTEKWNDLGEKSKLYTCWQQERHDLGFQRTTLYNYKGAWRILHKSL